MVFLVFIIKIEYWVELKQYFTEENTNNKNTFLIVRNDFARLFL